MVSLQNNKTSTAFNLLLCKLFQRLQADSRATDCCRFYHQKDHPSCRDNQRLNRTAGSQQVSKSLHEVLATEVNVHAQGKNCCVTIIKKLMCGWKLACVIA